MYDFLKVQKKWDNKLQRNVYTPCYVIKSNIKDLIIRGGKFYAIYDYDSGLWEMDDSRATSLIDEQVEKWVRENDNTALMDDQEHGPIVRRLSDTSNNLIKTWHNFCERDYRPVWSDKFKLNQKIIFSNTEVKATDYATFKLDYPLQDTPTPYYDKLCERLYLPSEQEKWEWFIGCLIAGDQSKIQKMLVFYGEPGTGKSTIIGKVIADNLFGGYETGYVVKFEANNLIGHDSFGTDFLSKDAVLCYDDDAEMNIITSKTTLNKIISHESIRVNAKFERPFNTKPNCLLIVGSNEPVQMSPNSGMNRRLIDVRPTGNKLSAVEYDDSIGHLPFEKSGIAWKCLQVYKKLGRHYYDHYIAEDMLSRTSPFQNFVEENYILLKDGISLAAAYKLYNDYAAECNFKNVLARYKFRDTLKLYFDSYEDMKFGGFKPEKIGLKKPESETSNTHPWLEFNSTNSLFDELYSDAPAQYEQDNLDHPLKYAWDNCTTTLKQLDTSKIHYVRVPINLIVVDLDIKDGDGKKSFEKNLEAANKFPPTYAELSKSGCGIHLHYIYTGGNPEELSRIYGDNVEIKVFNGKSALRRKLTKCNNLPIAQIASGLPLKEGASDVIDWEGFKNEKVLRAQIVNALLKKHHGHTKPECDFIFKILDEAYRSEKPYDVRDMENDVFTFALNSSNKSEYCMELVNQMHFCSKDIDEKENIETSEYKEAPIIFLDCEIFPSYEQAKRAGADIPENIPKDTPALFLVNWKLQDDVPYQFDENRKVIPKAKHKTVVRMINPTPDEITNLFQYRIIGYNNRKYDNHMLYARSQGYTSEELYNLSSKLVAKDRETSSKATFAPAYNLSYADVYNFVTKKQSLKKYEIDFGATHLEWNHPWNLPVPEKEWTKVAEYCDNDVLSTEITFDGCHDEFLAIEMLADLAGGTVNDTINSLSTKFVFGDEKDPVLTYTDFTTGKQYTTEDYQMPIISEEDYAVLGDDWTGIKPNNKNHFPGYHLVRTTNGTLHNMFRGIDIGRGGYVYANYGMYGRAVTKDVASMHPHSIKELNLFGDYTSRYVDLMEARILIKHGELDKVKTMFNGTLAPYLTEKRSVKALSTALKLVLNSFYGMTSSPGNYFVAKDSRNINNIVALRGALVMKMLQDEIEAKRFKVIHIKTDSIKIANPTDEILNYIDDFGKQYGYTYEVEHTWNRICLKDDAQFIGLHDTDDPESPLTWEATGKYFSVPYVFKSLFTHEPIIFEDFCETFNVKQGALHLVKNEGEQNETDEFIGRVGRFTPVINGGVLYRVNEGKRYAATGTKGYLWAESDQVKTLHLENDIDKSYYQKKCDDAIEEIKKFGNYEWFVSGVDNFGSCMNLPENLDEEVPFN
ncbi:DUF5906 domain-containing protein [Lachnoclostridium sp. Marseille-P6806]|uniref:DUF5906 domain-containing protein n=1 Tax=Lachnoclostridium sp. Marseille-P6806 TaxID=2364793 RepID=UPI0010317C75|nr:DUF5906 domain-containing protein [Lachnoclostridium sp. Marseille-P6806]